MVNVPQLSIMILHTHLNRSFQTSSFSLVLVSLKDCFKNSGGAGSGGGGTSGSMGVGFIGSATGGAEGDGGSGGSGSGLGEGAGPREADEMLGEGDRRCRER